MAKRQPGLAGYGNQDSKKKKEGTVIAGEETGKGQTSNHIMYIYIIQSEFERTQNVFVPHLQLFLLQLFLQVLC